MAAAIDLPTNLVKIEKFVKDCATIFRWEDLSEDTVMDIGCGSELYCARTVLLFFPNVKSIIALDSCEEQIQLIDFKSPRITEILADILERSDIRQYEGKVDKVLSTNVLQLITNKEDVFENVYRLLKPGGEAAFLFSIDMALYHVLKILRQDARFKDYFRGSDVFEMFSRELKADNYREMLGKIGFKVVKVGEEKQYFSMLEFGLFENEIMDNCVRRAFSVPDELEPEIQKSASDLYRNKYFNQNSIYALTMVSIFVIKSFESDTA